MIDFNKSLKKTTKITDDLIHRLYDYIGENTIILEIDYLNKKFSIERKFKNNLDGDLDLKNTIYNFDTEEKVKKHFNLK